MGPAIGLFPVAYVSAGCLPPWFGAQNFQFTSLSVGRSQQRPLSQLSWLPIVCSSHCTLFFFCSTEAHAIKRRRCLSGDHIVLRGSLAFKRTGPTQHSCYCTQWPLCPRRDGSHFCAHWHHPFVYLAVVLLSTAHMLFYYFLSPGLEPWKVNSMWEEKFSLLLRTLTDVCTSSSKKENIPFIGFIFGERWLPTLCSEVIFSISGWEGKCLAKP